MSKAGRKLKRHMVLCALVAAVTAAGAMSLVQAQIVVAQQQAQPASAPAEQAASEPAGKPGEPGMAPKPRKPDEHDPGAMMDRAAESPVQAYVDDSFPAVEKLVTATRYANQGQNQLAITEFQKIIEEYGQKLVYLNDNSYVSITDFVRQKLLAMPAVKDGMYDQMYGADARKAVDAALQNHDLSELIRVCDRYFPAAAARDGLGQAAEWYYERGEFAGAARTWQLLMIHPMASSEQRAVYLFRAAVAESMAGNKLDAAAMRDQLAKEFPDAKGPVDGQEKPLLSAADEILALPPLVASAASPDEWPAFQGGPTHSNLITVESSIGARLWSTSLEDPAISGKKERAPRPPAMVHTHYGQMQPADPNAQVLDSYPVISNGVVYVHTGERVMALSINGGDVRWTFPSGETVARVDENQAQMMRNMYGGMVRGPVGHDSVAVAGNQIFAVLPAKPAPNSNENVRRYGYMVNTLGNTQLVCLDRQGKEIWSKLASDIKLAKAGNLSFIGSPVVTQQGVFVMARKAGDGGFAELYLVRADRETGSISWSCYLCSTSSGSYYMPIMPQNIPIPTVVDDVVYVCSGEGADCAVDANAGRILWLQITDAARETRNINQIYNPTFTQAVSWQFNPPLVSGDKLIACETTDSGSYLRIYNRWTGKLLHCLKKQDLADMGVGKIRVLAGVIGSSVIVIGDNVCAIGINDASKLWDVSIPSDDGKMEGRPFLSSTVLYVPFTRGMLKVDPRSPSGKTLSFWDWPNTEQSEKADDGTQKAIPGKPGNLLVTSEQVIVVNDDEIAGYSKWETARDNRLARIQANPNDPEAYLALAEISFRTSPGTDHMDMADANMKRAVELANAQAAADSQGSELLNRLYRTNLDFAQQLLGDTDTVRRARARFYYDQCRQAARSPEQQAEWRLCMSELSLAEKKPDEAAMLYNEVLTDPSLRGAPYKRADSLARAGATAEQLFRVLINKEPTGAAIYRRFEDQAAALLNKARATKDRNLLSQVIDGYPNSVSAIAAATDLATAAREAHDPASELKALYWLGLRVTDDKKKAAVIAETATACLALPKPRFASAMAWTERGLRQYKDFTWTDPLTHQSVTFEGLRDQIRADPAAASTRGRLPVLPAMVSVDGNPQHKAPDMQPISANDPPLIVGSLLAPVEDSPALRRPDLLFTLHSGSLHIFDTAHNTELTNPQNGLALPPDQDGHPGNQPTILLGCAGDTAVLVQRTRALGIDLKSRAVSWQLPLSGGALTGPSRVTSVQQARLIALRQVQMNGQFIDPQTGQIVTLPPPDAEAARMAAFASLGNPTFNTLRLVNDKLIAIAGDKMSAINLTTGKLIWPGDGEVAIPTPGAATSLQASDDVVIVEMDAANRGSTTYAIFDAETGKFRKQLKLEERPQWCELSDDGVFFTVSAHEMDAFEVFSGDSAPLWRRTDLHCAYPSATLLTLDGLLVVNNPCELMCLSAETGERRWPTQDAEPVNLPPPASIAGRPAFLRSQIVGDEAVYQSGNTLLAYQTAVAPGDHLTWRAEVYNVPPLTSFQASDAYVVAMAEGPMGTMQHSVDLVFYSAQGGKCLLQTRLLKKGSDNQGPTVRSWQAVDNGIAMEIGGEVQFYHGRKNLNAAAPESP